MFHKDLITYLQNNPYVQSVYMNDEGGWLLHPRTAFPNEVSRIEILGAKWVKHTITEEDLANNPKLVESGINAGDEIEFEEAIADELPDEVKQNKQSKKQSKK